MPRQLPVTCVAGLAVAGALVIVVRAQNSRSIHPAVIQYSESIYSSAGVGLAPIRTHSETLAVRSDGSVSVARLMTARAAAAMSTPPFILRIVDVPDKRYIVVDQFTKSKTTYPSEQMVEARDIHPALSCVGTPGVNMLGLRTLLQVETVTLPDGRTSTSRYWRSPDVDCLPLRVERQSQRDGRAGSLTVRAAASVTMADPPSWYFEVPANFVERPPTEVLAEAERLNNASGR